MMARCTAPVNGHRSSSAAANCPACRGGRRGFRSPIYTYPDRDYSYRTTSSSSSNGGSTVRSTVRRSKPRWSKPSSPVYYTEAEVRTLTPVRQNVEKRITTPDLRDVFLCHAWDDRKGAAKDLHDLLESKGVSVWFSEKDVLLGSTLLREIDKGLAKSRVGIVLVTQSFLRRIQGEGIADKELSALLARDLLVPIMHEATFGDLREVSPLLGSRSGLCTSEDSMGDIAAKLAELVAPE